MAVHFFHCTNGIDLVVDRTGRDIAAVDEISSHARAVATDLIQAVPGYSCQVVDSSASGTASGAAQSQSTTLGSESQGGAVSGGAVSRVVGRC